MPLPSTQHKFPWHHDITPLMLAPMQGLTNRGLRDLFATWVRPDTLFTEFMRVAPGETGKRLSATDLREMTSEERGIPLVVQLIGHGSEELVQAARIAQQNGAIHINLNLGCPFGRMTTGLTGGGILQKPELLQELIPALRAAISGSFSVKTRTGYADPQQIFSLLPLFASSGVDFLVLHPRTVVQEYKGQADHAITARVVQETGIPVIANGDVRTVSTGLQVLEQTGAAGLMLGRGAIADPLLFTRLRSGITSEPSRMEQAEMLHYYLTELLGRYQALFCGEQQILGKVKSVFACMEYPAFTRQIKGLQKATSISRFTSLLETLGD